MEHRTFFKASSLLGAVQMQAVLLASCHHRVQGPDRSANDGAQRSTPGGAIGTFETPGGEEGRRETGYTGHDWRSRGEMVMARAPV